MRKTTISSALVLFFAILFAIGMFSFLHPCVHEDGAVSACGWAGKMLKGLSLVLVFQSVLLFLSETTSVRSVLALSMLPVSLLSMLTPGRIIGLCMMNTMRCNSVMRPAVMLLSGAIFVLCLGYFVCDSRKAKRKERT